MDRPGWITSAEGETIFTLLDGIAMTCEIYNAGHTPDWLLRAVLWECLTLAEDESNEAIEYWKWRKAQGG